MKLPATLDPKTRAGVYAAAAPFPHIVIDDFLPVATYRALRDEFPKPDADIWLQYRSGRENKKLQSRDHSRIPAVFRELIDVLNGPDFLCELEALTGIDGLIADPALTGGGLHQTLPGGHLAMHVDYNRHRVTGDARRLNVILYLNDEWVDAWGGHLEFWGANMTEKGPSISPIGNRLVIFSTSEQSWHGHPEALACPSGVTRRSVALYYYTAEVAEQAQTHSTIFRERPGERFHVTARERFASVIRRLVANRARGREA